VPKSRQIIFSLRNCVDGKFWLPSSYSFVIMKNHHRRSLELASGFSYERRFYQTRKYRGVRLILSNGMLHVFANNPAARRIRKFPYCSIPRAIIMWSGLQCWLFVGTYWVSSTHRKLRLSLNDSNSRLLIEEADSHAAAIRVIADAL